MKQFIEIYHENQSEIEAFIINTLKNNGEIKKNEIDKYKENFKNFPSMELLYITDRVCKQITPNIYRNRYEEEAKGQDRGYLSKKLIEKDKQFSISDPYLSSATGNICITVMKKEHGHHIFIDFVVSELLGRLGLIELHPTFEKINKTFYKTSGFLLMSFALLAIAYALFSFFNHFFGANFSLDTLFKPIVTVTLGLAIFDLAKTILEREVYYKSYRGESEDAMVLTKFSIAIIIALSIEALMVVFKVAMHDLSDMIYALYLIIGVGIIIVSLGVYNYLSKK